ncbi:MAG: tetratricopeptide repeat protein, partial [Acidobacteriota bacterium]
EHAASQLGERLARVKRLESNPRADAEGRGWAWGQLGMLLHAFTELESAAVCYQYAARLDAADPRWIYLLAHVDRSVGRFAASSAGFSRVLELDPNVLPARYWRGRNAVETSRWAAAESDFNAILSREPGHVAALLGAAQVALGNGDGAAALDLLERARSRVEGPDPTALIELQLAAHRKLGELDAAKAMAARLPTQKLGRGVLVQRVDIGQRRHGEGRRGAGRRRPCARLRRIRRRRPIRTGDEKKYRRREGQSFDDTPGLAAHGESP